MPEHHPLDVLRNISKMSKYDLAFMPEILDRAKRIWPGLDKEALRIRLIAYHCNHTMLDFKGLLELPVKDFIDDITEIMTGIDGTTFEPARALRLASLRRDK